MNNMDICSYWLNIFHIQQSSQHKINCLKAHSPSYLGYYKAKGMQPMTEIDDKIEFWKKQLLDLGRRNRLISYKETKNSNIKIIRPNYDDLYKKLVISRKQLRFPYTPPKALED